MAAPRLCIVGTGGLLRTNAPRRSLLVPVLSGIGYCFVSCLKFSEYGPPRCGCSEMDASELDHEGLPHSFATLFKKLCSNR